MAQAAKIITFPGVDSHALDGLGLEMSDEVLKRRDKLLLHWARMVTTLRQIRGMVDHVEDAMRDMAITDAVIEELGMRVRFDEDLDAYYVDESYTEYVNNIKEAYLAEIN